LGQHALSPLPVPEFSQHFVGNCLAGVIEHRKKKKKKFISDIFFSSEHD